MKRCMTLVGVLAAMLVFVGCEKKQEKAPPKTGATTPAAGGANAAAQEAEATLSKVLANIKDGRLDQAEAELKALEAKKSSLPRDLQDKIAAARTSLDAAKAAKAPTSTPVVPPVATVPVTPPVATAPVVPPATVDTKPAAANAAEAESLLAKIMTWIKEKKFDQADEGLKKLEGQKSTLPANLQDQVGSTRKALDAAKLANKLPALP